MIGTWGTFDILSGNLDNIPDFFQTRGLGWLWKIITKPYRLDKVWKAIQFYFYFKFSGLKKRTDPEP